MANNSSATPITTGSVTAEPKKNGIYYFKLDSRYFLYDGDEQRICGLSGAEIDSDLHFLSGMDIKDVVLNPEEGTITISRVNGEDFSAITLDIKETHPKSLVFSADTGELFLEYPDGTTLRTEGFFVDFNDEGKYNVKIYTDGTLDGLGDMYKPLSLSRLERTGTYAPVETVIDGPITGEYIGHRVLTKEPVDDYGHLYAYPDLEAIQSALDAENSPWRVPTKADWDEMLNAMEETAKDHDETSTGYKGESAGCFLKSTKYWDYGQNANVNQEEHEYVGFNILPVGYAPAGRGTTMGAEDFDIENFGSNAGFWTRNEEKNEESWVKVFGAGFDSVRQYKEETEDAGTLYSIRLLKECEPGCPEQYETILGDSYPVGPIVGCFDDYCKIWTLSNFYGTGDGYSGITLDGDREQYAYFINECDGKKKRMMEGESIVILDRDGLHEHRIINGELVDTQKWIDDKINNLDEDINDSISWLSASTVEEISALSDRTETALSELSANTDTAINELSANTVATVTNETARALIEEGRLSDRIEAVVNNLSGLSAYTRDAVDGVNSSINGVDAKIDAEIERSTNEDIALNNKINAVAAIVSGNGENITQLQSIVEQTMIDLEELSDEVDEDIAETNDRITELSGSTVRLYDNVTELINENEVAHDSILDTISETADVTLDTAKDYTDEQIAEVNAVKVNDIYYDERLKHIKLLKADGTLTEGIPADDFLKDSVLTSVEYDEGNNKLIFVWNDDYTTRTPISLEKLANIYGISADSLAYLKMSGTNVSAIVDKADGFEKTLATTKFVEDRVNELSRQTIEFASGVNETLRDIVEASNDNRDDIDRLNGDKDVAGSVKHTVDDKFSTALLTAGLPVTNVSVEDASNNSLLRAIVVNGEIKYFASNKAKDMTATNRSGSTLVLNDYINSLEAKIEALEGENRSLRDRVSILESRVNDIASTGIDETGVKQIIKNYLKGTDREIKLTESGGTLQVGFSDDAVFGWTM